MEQFFKIIKRQGKFKKGDIIKVSPGAEIREKDYILISTDGFKEITRFSKRTPKENIIGKIVCVIRDFQNTNYTPKNSKESDKNVNN